MKECEHKFIHIGVVYSNGHQIPGSGACWRIYEDKFFCERCLETIYRNTRTHGDSYTKPLKGAIPK